METIVVMAIFVMLITSFSEIFIRTSRGAQQVALRARLQADTRLAAEAIARALRVSNIDYAAYGGTLPAMPTDELRLSNPDAGTAVRVRHEPDDADCYGDADSFPCMVVSTDGGASWAPLTPKGTRLEYLNFYAAPDEDPFLFDPGTGTYPNDEAPRVTMAFGLRGLADRPTDEWVYQVQTTVTPRFYKR